MCVDTALSYTCRTWRGLCELCSRDVHVVREQTGVGQRNLVLDKVEISSEEQQFCGSWFRKSRCNYSGVRRRCGVLSDYF